MTWSKAISTEPAHHVQQRAGTRIERDPPENRGARPGHGLVLMQLISLMLIGAGRPPRMGTVPDPE
jgi:hypothetical protein